MQQRPTADISRRTFLKQGAWTIAAVSLSIGTLGSAADGETAGDCVTTGDILGPFYRRNAPFRNDLTGDGVKGRKLVVKGRVIGSDCKTVVKDALVDVWQCDDNGEYDNRSNNFRLRGRQRVDDSGEYAFTTIMPGRYLNGRQFRPAHIHFRVTGAGHRELISQLYFAGDPHIDDDPWASSKRATHRVLAVKADADGIDNIVFDIHLEA